MLTVLIRPSSSEGRVLYHGPPCAALEVVCSDAELCVSSVTGQEVLCQLRITTPPGLFRPFYVSSSETKRCSSVCEINNGHAVATNDLSTVSEIGNPIVVTSDSEGGCLGSRCENDSEILASDFSTFRIVDEDSNFYTDSEIGDAFNLVDGPASDLQMYHDSKSDHNASNCNDDALQLKFSTLTTHDPDWDRQSVTNTCNSRYSVSGPTLDSLGGSKSSAPPNDYEKLTSKMCLLTTDDPLSDNVTGDPMKDVGGPETQIFQDPQSDDSDCQNGTLTPEFCTWKTAGTGLRTETLHQQGTCRQSFAGLSFSVIASRPDHEQKRFTLPSTMKDFLKHRHVRPGTPLYCHCAACGRTLSRGPIRFERVEQCCEGLTSEMSENWFCHPSDATPPVTKHTQPSSLFYDTTCFYLNESACELLALVGKDFRCPGCGSYLSSWSRSVEGFETFFCDRIEFRVCGAVEDGGAQREIPYWFEAMWVSLWAMIRSAFETSPVCRLYLHSKGASGKETCFLLWVSAEKEPFFLLRGSKGQELFRPEEAHPVRYLITTPSSPEVRSWRHDFDVDFFRVSDAVSTLLVECLRETDTCCHPSKEIADCCFKEESACCVKEGIFCCSKEENTCTSNEGDTCCFKEKITCCSKKGVCFCSKERTSRASKGTSTCCCKEGFSDGFRSALLPASLRGTRYFFNKA